MQASGDIRHDVEFALDTLSPSQILAVEVFRSAAEVPIQYGGGSAACGVILIWTVSGLPPT